MSWRLARSLVTLLNEVNAAAPTRSRASDGTIGDPAHSARVSDHNPNEAGVVRAVDITDDVPRFSAAEFAERIRLLGLAGHPALGPGAYVIWNRRIASATQDGQPWDWEPYGGSNPHDKHVHVSVATGSFGYDSTALWGVMQPTGPTPAQQKQARQDRRTLKRVRAAEWSARHSGREGIANRLRRIRDRLKKKGK